MIMVTVMTVYPATDDRNASYSFIQEGSISEYIHTIPNNYDMTIEDARMLADQHTYQITGHLNYGWEPIIIITIKELVNNECLLSDIYKCEEGNFDIKILNSDRIDKDLILHNPRVQIKNVYITYTDDDNGYDDYNVYEIEIVK